MTEVSCALIIMDAKVLATQRSSTMPLPFKWEFPGGKVEAGETAEQSLVREIQEELSLEVRILAPLTPNEHTYHMRTIRLIPFICQIANGNLHLHEHRDFKWLGRHELQGLDWAEADLPIVAELARKWDTLGLR